MAAVADAADVAWPDDAVEVGRVVDAWGVKGWFKVQPYARDPQALFSSRRWYLVPGEDQRLQAQRPTPRLLKITAAREHGEAVVASAQEIDDRAAAEALRGARVHVARASFPTADPDEYYWVDLIGMAVVNREGHSLGTVEDLLDTGAHSVLRVSSPGADERLIPFVSAYVDDVDLQRRRITVDWGLDY